MDTTLLANVTHLRKIADPDYPEPVVTLPVARFVSLYLKEPTVQVTPTHDGLIEVYDTEFLARTWWRPLNYGKGGRVH